VLLTLLSPQTSTLTGTLSRTLGGATLVSSGELVTPSTLSAILIGSSNNPSYRSGFYSPRRGGTPKYPSLWDGCVGAWAPSLGATGGRLFDHSLFGNHGTLSDMDLANDWVVSGGKLALDFDGVNDYVVSDANGFNNSVDMTLSFWVRIRSESSFARLVEKGANTEWACVVNENGAGTVSFVPRNRPGAGASDHVTMSYTANQWFHLCASLESSKSLAIIYRNGRVENTRTQSGMVATDDVSSIFISRFGGGGYHSDIQIDDIRIYNRALSDKEIRTLATRRGIAFERASRKLSVFSAPAPTGSLSSTLANATLSSSGTLASGLTGTVSVTLADATLSATGTLTNAATGSLSITLANATLSGTGTVSAGASGTVSSTLDAATLSSNGTIGSGLTGSVSATLAAATCSSSGTLTAGLSGTVVRTLDAVTSSATGTLTNGASGSVTRTLANATLASGGSLSAGLTAQVNRALESCVVSSSGTLASGLTGSLSVQLASATLQSGNIAVGGLRIKVGGEWKNANAFVKVTGTWKNATPFVKVSGVWK